MCVCVCVSVWPLMPAPALLCYELWTGPITQHSHTDRSLSIMRNVGAFKVLTLIWAVEPREWGLSHSRVQDHERWLWGGGLPAPSRTLWGWPLWWFLPCRADVFKTGWWCWASLVVQMVKSSACNVGDLGSIPGSGRAPGEGNGNPLQSPCLENPTVGGTSEATVHGVTKSWTRLRFRFQCTWIPFVKWKHRLCLWYPLERGQRALAGEALTWEWRRLHSRADFASNPLGELDKLSHLLSQVRVW